MSSTMASYAAVFDAGQVRIAELGDEIVRLNECGEDGSAVVAAVFDLARKLEALAQTDHGPERAALLGYLIETYGLLAKGTDPLLRPNAPVIPAQGSEVRPRVRAVNGHAVTVNDHFTGAGARLVPNPII